MLTKRRYTYDEDSKNKIVEQNDDQKIKKIINLLQKYHLGLYLDDVKNWEDSNQVEEHVLFETKKAIAYFINDKFVNSRKELEYEKIQLAGGYKLDQKNRLLEVNFKYNESSIYKIKYNWLNVKKNEVIQAIKKEINQITFDNAYIENNWSSPAFAVDVFGQKIYKDVLKKLKDQIEVKNEKVFINKYRLKLNSWNVERQILNKKVIYWFSYQEIAEKIDLNINLKHKLNSGEILQKIIPYLKLKNFLEINLNEVIDVNRIEYYKNLIENWYNKIKETLKIIPKLLNIDLSNLKFSIVNWSPVGRFENQIMINFNLGKSSNLLTLKLNFLSKDEETNTQILENAINERLENLYFLESSIDKLSNENLLSIIKETLNETLVVNNEKVPLNTQNMTMLNYVKTGSELISKIRKNNFNKDLIIKNKIVKI